MRHGLPTDSTWDYVANLAPESSQDPAELILEIGKGAGIYFSEDECVPNDASSGTERAVWTMLTEAGSDVVRRADLDSWHVFKTDTLVLVPNDLSAADWRRVAGEALRLTPREGGALAAADMPPLTPEQIWEAARILASAPGSVG
ncbi:hypothetical protein [Nocardioides cavernaquae]|uniref:Uncharacterized protein n=1 Tax=Nocardioides cavernaquae TaxID=2321396 RepID=A0A3A5H9W6_9ACTN|nr:hypothetical protein [Nocardioides cavernaquae]RJS47426.1 hypothetical protein D4739_15185 [Nocardioides cavernaquae]